MNIVLTISCQQSTSWYILSHYIETLVWTVSTFERRQMPSSENAMKYWNANNCRAIILMAIVRRSPSASSNEGIPSNFKANGEEKIYRPVVTSSPRGRHVALLEASPAGIHTPKSSPAAIATGDTGPTDTTSREWPVRHTPRDGRCNLRLYVRTSGKIRRSIRANDEKRMIMMMIMMKIMTVHSEEERERGGIKRKRYSPRTKKICSVCGSYSRSSVIWRARVR